MEAWASPAYSITWMSVNENLLLVYNSARYQEKRKLLMNELFDYFFESSLNHWIFEIFPQTVFYLQIKYLIKGFFFFYSRVRADATVGLLVLPFLICVETSRV